MQKAIWFFPVGVLIGAALAWVFLTSLSESSERGLTGEPPPPAPDAPSSPRPDELPNVDVTAGFDFHRFQVKPELAVIYWSSLAVADAISGRSDHFVTDATRILKAGGGYEDVQRMLAYLPKEVAAGVMERLIAAFPDRSWDRWRLADLYVAAEQAELAFETLLADLKASDRNPRGAISRLVRIDPTRAGSALLALAEELEWDSSVLIHCAEELLDADQGSLARPLLLLALELNPADEDGIDLMSLVDPAMAMALAVKAVEAEPDNGDAWARLALLRKESGDRAGAFEAYHRAATATPDDDARLDLMRGMIQMDAVAALPIIRNLAEGGDDETMGVLGQAYLAAGQRDAAFAVYIKAHEFDPSDSEWLHRMVAIDPVRSAEDFARKIDESPGTGNDELVGTYALSLERQGKGSEAYEEYLRAWRMDEEDWEWMRGLARTNPVRAAELLEEKHRENPDSGAVAGALADAYAGMGRTTEAVRLYEKAIEGGEEEHRWMSALAAVEPARGLPMLRAAVEDDPDDDEYWGALGDAYYALGRMDESRQAYDRALELDPSDWEWSVQRARIP